MKRVMVADGNRRLGHLMGRLLDDDRRFTVVGVVSGAAEAVQQARALVPEVVLVSEHLEDVRGSALCGALRLACPTAALLLWAHEPEQTLRQQPDVDGVLERGMTYEELARAVRRVQRGAARVIDLSALESERTGRP